MMKFLTENWEKIAIILGPVVTWIFTKRPFQKKDLEEKEVNISISASDVISRNLQLYQKMLDDIEERYQKQLKDRDLEISRLEKENVKLQEKVDDLSYQVKRLMNHVKELDDLIKNIQ